MKKNLLFFTLLASTVFLQAQIVTVTVSIGAGYISQKWYGLENGEVASQPKDNWDLAFEITGYSSTILANTQKPNFALYKAPYSISNYGTIDTAGIKNWPILYNSDTTWAVGALNKGVSTSNPNDLGWGIYDINTHFVTGDSCYVVKISPTTFKKLKIVNLANSVYTFEYADISGANSQTTTISKSGYTGKNFAYFDLATNAALNREPVSSSWDLTFGRYTAILLPGNMAYPVVGVLSNKGVKIAQLNNIANPSSFSGWSGEIYSDNISTLGHDWKTVDVSTSQWKIVNDTIYFIRDKTGNIWKLRFIAFGGSANGDFVFSKEKLSLVGISEAGGDKITQMAIYPNPASGENTSLVFFSDNQVSNIEISLSDMNGKIIQTDSLNAGPGLNTHQINTKQLGSGIYLIKVGAGSHFTVKKLIIQ